MTQRASGAGSSGRPAPGEAAATTQGVAASGIRCNPTSQPHHRHHHCHQFCGAPHGLEAERAANVGGVHGRGAARQQEAGGRLGLQLEDHLRLAHWTGVKGT
jgi:hypothetical protein